MPDKKDRFRVALVQMRSGRDVRENLLEAEAFIRDAARKGAQFIQTPENTLLMETETARLFERIAPKKQPKPSRISPPWPRASASGFISVPSPSRSAKSAP